MDCWRLRDYINQKLFGANSITVKEAIKRLQTESNECIHAESFAKSFFEGFEELDIWATLSKREFPVCRHLESSLTKLERKGIKKGTVVYLGCGNSKSTTYLLEKGYNVIALDNSKEALENLIAKTIQLNPLWHSSGQLTTVCQNMETYCFPNNVQLILADNSLMHCDPMKIQALFKKIYRALSKGGLFIGNFYSTPKDPMIETVFRAVFKVWFADKALTNFLLDDAGFHKEMPARVPCILFSDTILIEFIGQKIDEELIEL